MEKLNLAMDVIALISVGISFLCSIKCGRKRDRIICILFGLSSLLLGLDMVITSSVMHLMISVITMIMILSVLILENKKLNFFSSAYILY